MDIFDYGKLGFGTFGSDRYSEEVVANAVYEAIKAGYRIFDCASVYGNEKQIGQVFLRAFNEGIVKREELYIVSKVWNDSHDEGKVIASCKQSISDLNVGYLDLYLVHWPYPNYHAKGCTVDSRNPDSKPFFTADYMVAWRQMEQLKNDGLVCNIGMSNMTIPKLEAVLPLCKTKPYVHEIELHPSFQQTELVAYSKLNGMHIMGYCPIGSPNRPERDKTEHDVADTQMAEVVAVASAHNCHPAEICLRWAMQQGYIPIPFASSTANILNNLAAADKCDLTANELASIAAADKGCRLVKGHVFLWEGAVDYRDLWDIDGTLDEWIATDKGYIRK